MRNFGHTFPFFLVTLIWTWRCTIEIPARADSFVQILQPIRVITGWMGSDQYLRRRFPPTATVCFQLFKSVIWNSSCASLRWPSWPRLVPCQDQLTAVRTYRTEPSCRQSTVSTLSFAEEDLSTKCDALPWEPSSMSTGWCAIVSRMSRAGMEKRQQRKDRRPPREPLPIPGPRRKKLRKKRQRNQNLLLLHHRLLHHHHLLPLLPLLHRLRKSQMKPSPTFSKSRKTKFFNINHQSLMFCLPKYSSMSLIDFWYLIAFEMTVKILDFRS